MLTQEEIKELAMSYAKEHYSCRSNEVGVKLMADEAETIIRFILREHDIVKTGHRPKHTTSDTWCIKLTQRPEFFVFRDDRENFDEKVFINVDRIKTVVSENEESRIILKDGWTIPVRESAQEVFGMINRVITDF